MWRALSKKFSLYLMVGVVNTVLGAGIIFALINIFHFSYILSTAFGYGVGFIISYILNRHFTFQSRERLRRTLWRFVLVALLAYGLAAAVGWAVSGIFVAGSHLPIARSNVAAAVSMVVYVVSGFIGNNYFTFYSKTT